MRDVIVIGKGPAGISAAIYLKRANIDVLVIGKGKGSLEKAEAIENYYGFVEPISGTELLDRGIAQAERLGVEILSDEVVGIKQEEGFVVETSNSKFEAKVILLATGMSRAGLKVKGFEALSGKGISFCAVCDGFFYRNKALAVIGNGDYAASEIADLNNFTQNIKLFTNGLAITTDKLAAGQVTVSDKIIGIKGQDRVEAIITDKDEYPVDGIFVAMGTASATDFAKSLGALTEGINLIVNENFMTTVDGIFAAGDCIGGFWQVSKSVSDGANASRHIIKYLKTSPL